MRPARGLIVRTGYGTMPPGSEGQGDQLGSVPDAVADK